MAWGRGYPKKNKYGAIKTNGFSSKLESALHNILLNRQDKGELSNIKTQVNVHLTRAKILYIADFSAELKDGTTVYFESKGFKTQTWAIKKRLWEKYGPGRLEIWEGSYQRPYLKETIESEGFE